jgi:hypothetical protein
LSPQPASAIEAHVIATTRALVVAIVLASWIAISNHCAFAAIMAKPKAAESECPFHSKPSKPQPAPMGVQCCKILRAVPTTSAKTVARAVVDLPHVDPAFAKLVAFAPPQIAFTRTTLDTGPPGTTSFPELIGSMQTHAPPPRG